MTLCVSLRRWRWFHACWLAVLVSASVIACQTVPITSRSQLLLLPETEEVQMGVQSYQQVLRKSKLSADSAANDLVRRVGTRIKQIEAWLPEAMQYYRPAR